VARSDGAPDEIETLYRRGTAFYQAGNHMSAESAFRQMVALVSVDDQATYSRAAYSLALPLIGLGQTTEARKWLEAALAANPKFERARKRLDDLTRPIEPATPRCPPPTSPGNIVGQARKINRRSERNPWLNNSQIVIWNLRIERIDESGHPLPPVPVELRGKNIVGDLTDGDCVEIPGSWRPGSSSRLSTLQNRTTGDVISVKSEKWMWIVVVVSLLAIAIFMISLSLQH
jgi:tetratricopeptide (TPR) repeat protein